MLVLTRRIGESVLIGDEIEVTLLDVKGDSVRLGIKAPRTTRIQRSEIVQAVEAENVAASASGANAADDILAALTRRRDADS